jgi:hypothetical protein
VVHNASQLLSPHNRVGESAAEGWRVGGVLCPKHGSDRHPMIASGTVCGLAHGVSGCRPVGEEEERELTAWPASDLRGPMEVLVIVVIVVLVWQSQQGRCWPCATLRRPTSAPPGADPASSSSKEPDASESTTESPTPRHTEDPS